MEKWMMEQMIAEIRTDVKEILQTQSRMEEQQRNLKEDMLNLEAEFKPISRFHEGAKWSMGAIGILVPVIALIFKMVAK